MRHALLLAHIAELHSGPASSLQKLGPALDYERAAMAQSVRAPLIPMVVHLFPAGLHDGSLQVHAPQHDEHDKALATARQSGLPRDSFPAESAVAAEEWIPA